MTSNDPASSPDPRRDANADAWDHPTVTDEDRFATVVNFPHLDVEAPPECSAGTGPQPEDAAPQTGAPGSDTSDTELLDPFATLEITEDSLVTESMESVPEPPPAASLETPKSPRTPRDQPVPVVPLFPISPLSIDLDALPVESFDAQQTPLIPASHVLAPTVPAPIIPPPEASSSGVPSAGVRAIPLSQFDTIASEGPSAGSSSPTGYSQSDSLRAPLPGKESDQARYELVENFAQGGLGKIWRARDVRIRREVAYKEILPAALHHESYLERFLEEAQITGQLEHPGIVPIYDLGWQENGTPFYSMKLVRGITFKQAIEDYHKLPPGSSERRLAFVKHLGNFVDICNALAFAHDHGVIHRDLKPQNVMIGSFGETLVLDWGLAKLVGTSEEAVEIVTSPADQKVVPDDATLVGSTIRHQVTSNARSLGTQTQLGSVMGTPAYMPPEQARGQWHEIDPRSDIYSLGAILYELLTNRQPIERGTLGEMLQNVVAGKIAPPRSIDPKIPKPLEAICLKALSAGRDDRYAGALLLARDVEHYLADEPIAVYREPWYLRLRRWTRRHRTLVTSTGIALLMVALASGAWRATERIRLRNTRQTVQAALDAARQATAADDFATSKASLNEALGIVRTEPALADTEVDIRDRLDQVDRLIAARERDRVSKLRAQAMQKFHDAGSAEDAHEVELAATLLTEVATLLKGEVFLQEVRRDAEQRLAAVQQVIAEEHAAKAAQDRFVRFKHGVDRARFYASQFTGERVQNNSAQARTAALQALELYGLDATPPAALPSTGLAPAQVAEVRQDAYELMLILAEAQGTLARDLPLADRKQAWEGSLAWLKRARALGVDTRSLHLQEAHYLEELGRTADAGQARAAATGLKPATALEFFLLAEYDRKEGRYASAALLYQQALSLDPNYFLALYSLGLCNLQRVQAADAGAPDDRVDLSGYLSAAVTAFTTCLAQRPDFPWPYLLRGVAYADMENFDAAYGDFDRARETKVDVAGIYDPQLYQYGILMNRGVVLLKQKRLREAETEFRKAMQVRPDNADPHINLSLVLSQQEQPAGALDELTRAAQLDPRRAIIFRLRGDANLRLGADNAALADYEKAIELETSQKGIAVLFGEIGKIHHRAAKWNEALAAYDRSLQIVGENADTIRLRGEVLLELKRGEEAIAAFSKYLELSKPVGDVYRARGLANAKLGHYRAAVNDYTRSLELEPSPHMLTRRGWAYLLNARQLALDDFDESIKLNPDNGDSYNGRGFARVLLGKQAAAVQDAEEAVKRGPKSFEVYYNAATIFAQAVPLATRDRQLAERERTELAKTYTTRAVELIGQSSELLGPKNLPVLFKTIEADSALDPIRESPELIALLKKLRGS